MNIMLQCTNWMMSLGMAGMLLGVLLLLALLVLIVLLIRKKLRRPDA